VQGLDKVAQHSNKVTTVNNIFVHIYSYYDTHCVYKKRILSLDISQSFLINIVAMNSKPYSQRVTPHGGILNEIVRKSKYMYNEMTKNMVTW